MSKANKYSQSYQWEDKSRDLILRQLALPVGISTRPFIHLVMLYRILSTSASMFSCLSEEARRNSASSAVSRFFTASTIWRHLSRIFSSARCDEVAFACNEIVQITHHQLNNDSGPRVLVRGREDSDKMTAFGKNISWSLSVYELTFHNSCQSRICLHAWHTETLWLSAICKTSTSAHKSFYQPLSPNSTWPVTSCHDTHDKVSGSYPNVSIVNFVIFSINFRFYVDDTFTLNRVESVFRRQQKSIYFIIAHEPKVSTIPGGGYLLHSKSTFFQLHCTHNKIKRIYETRP